MDELDDRAAERLVRVLDEDITSSDLGENVDRFIVGLQSWVDNALPLGPAQSRAFDVGDLVERGRVERRSSDVDRRRVEIEFADQRSSTSSVIDAPTSRRVARPNRRRRSSYSTADRRSSASSSASERSALRVTRKA